MDGVQDVFEREFVAGEDRAAGHREGMTALLVCAPPLLPRSEEEVFADHAARWTALSTRIAPAKLDHFLPRFHIGQPRSLSFTAAVEVFRHKKSNNRVKRCFSRMVVES